MVKFKAVATYQLAFLRGRMPLIFPPFSSRLSSNSFSMTSLESTFKSWKWSLMRCLSWSSGHSMR